MRSENETSQSLQMDGIRQQMSQMRETIDLTRSDIRRTKSEVEHYQEAQESHARRTRALWAIVILLVLGAAGIWWYGAPLFQNVRALAGQMPLLQSRLNNVNARVTSTEQQVGGWGHDRAGFAERVSAIEASLKSNLQTAHNEAQRIAQQIRTETGRSFQALQNRVSGVESVQRESNEEVAKLRSELAGVRQELAVVREENARQSDQLAQIDQAHQTTRSDLSALDRRLASNRSDVGRLVHQVGRERIDFELQKGRTKQLLDGIYVTVKDTDVALQKVDGWLQIAGDGRFVWLRGEGAQHPIDFSSRADARAYQIVFTRIDRDGAAGYVLAPISDNAPAATDERGGQQ